MKKSLSLFMFCVLITLAGCGGVSTQKCNHEWIDATCTEPKICSLCEKTDGDELGHSTNQGTCDRCQEYTGKETWLVIDLVDEFKQTTGYKAIITSVTGTFSNSATTNSELYAALRVDPDGTVLIMLNEYGSYPVTCSYDYDKYNVIMLDTNKSKRTLKGTIYEDSTLMQFSSSDEKTIISALKKPGEVSFYIEEADRKTTNYLFTIETSNFKDLYENM